MKTPEQQAEEWFEAECLKGRTESGARRKDVEYDEYYVPIGASPECGFLAGHAAGKQEAEQRIWAEIEKHGCDGLFIYELKRIIFRGEKV